MSAENTSANLSITATGRLAPPRHRDAQRRPPFVRACGGEQPDVHRRHTHEDVDVLTDDQVQCARPVESRQQHQRRAGVEAGVHGAGLAERVEQRQASEDDVVLGQTQHRIGRDDRIHGDVQVGEDRPLGGAGGARRVEDDRGILGLGVDVRGHRIDGRRALVEPVDPLTAQHGEHLDAGLLGRRFALFEQRSRADQQLRAGVGQGVGDLPSDQQCVHRDHDRAEREHREVGPRKVGHVGDEYRHPVAGADALLGQHRGVPARLLPERRCS